MTYLKTKTKTKTNMQHIKHNLNFIIARNIVFYYQVLSCIILFIVVADCLFVLFCKKLCKTEISNCYRKKYKKIKIQNICTKQQFCNQQYILVSTFFSLLFFFFFFSCSQREVLGGGCGVPGLVSLAAADAAERFRLVRPPRAPLPVGETVEVPRVPSQTPHHFIPSDLRGWHQQGQQQ